MTLAEKKPNNYYFTFGQRYATEKHPTYPEAHPSKWVRIVADDYGAAREHAFYLFLEHFAKQYTEQEWKPEFFPSGEIESINI